MSTADKHVLYRFFDNEDELLYVGITMNPAARWPKHRSDKVWWSEVVDITLEVFDSRRDVLKAERKAIETEHPRYNIVHNATAAAVLPTVTIEWRCRMCSLAVLDGQGSLRIANHELNSYDQARTQWKERYGADVTHTLGDLMAHPRAVPWEASHWECENPDYPSGYDIEVSEIRTASQMLDWTAHLMSKNWFLWTNWEHVIHHGLASLGVPA